MSSDAKKDPRRIVFVTKKTSAKVVGDPGPQLMTYPHLLIREAIVFQVLVIAMVLVALFWDAPLEQLANPLLTPNPAKAPWYFLLLPTLRRGNFDSHIGSNRARCHSLLQCECRRRGNLVSPRTKSENCSRHRISPPGVSCRVPCVDDFPADGARCGPSAFLLYRSSRRKRLASCAGREARLLVGHDLVYRCCSLFDCRGHVFPWPGLVLGLAVENSCRLKKWAN